MFEPLFKQNNEYDIMKSQKIVIKKNRNCLNCFKSKHVDLNYKTYQLECTMYNGKYVLTYDQWVDKNN